MPLQTFDFSDDRNTAWPSLPQGGGRIAAQVARGLLDAESSTDWPQLPADFVNCLEAMRWDWGLLGPQGSEAPTLGGSVATAANLANTAGNLAAGPTGPGIGGVPSHATSWQHKLASQLGKAAQRAESGRSTGPTQASLRRVGRLAGRAALVPLLVEGLWDFVALPYCAVSTN
jgi:hypothetical protein